MGNWIDFKGKRYLVLGFANRKSIAWAVGSSLEQLGAQVVYSVRSPLRQAALAKLTPAPSFVCDVEDPQALFELAQQVGPLHGPFHGLVHSIAFANYSEGLKPFHETLRADFLQAATISAFSLVEMARAFKPYLVENASVVALGISSQVTAETYGYMSPIKAALESCVRFLAKSFSKDTRIRFNCVKAGPLKTSASAGIPGYLDAYLYAEKMTLRKEGLQTQEVANAVLFLLSEASSGINAQGLVVNAGMDENYFDQSLIKRTEG